MAVSGLMGSREKKCESQSRRDKSPSNTLATDAIVIANVLAISEFVLHTRTPGTCTIKDSLRGISSRDFYFSEVFASNERARERGKSYCEFFV